MTRKEFSEKLVECRENAGCGKNELCRRTGFTFNQLQRLENASNNFLINNVFFYLKAIEVQLKLRNTAKKKSVTIKEYKNIIDWLTKNRKPNYTQRSLAEKIECSHITIANIESEKSVVSVDIFLRLVDVLENLITTL
jgi:transcriptional regulator with XRE-family HTH domain